MTFGTYEQRRAPDFARDSQRDLRVFPGRPSGDGNDADGQNLRVRPGRARHQALEQRSSDRRAEAAAKAQDAASASTSFGWERLSASAEVVLLASAKGQRAAASEEVQGLWRSSDLSSLGVFEV
jgi:hypothetical protein